MLVKWAYYLVNFGNNEIFKITSIVNNIVYYKAFDTLGYRNPKRDGHVGVAVFEYWKPIRVQPKPTSVRQWNRK